MMRLHKSSDYLHPDLIDVDVRPDLRRSPRAAPINLHAEIYTGWSPRPRDCHCLNISQHGMALICDLPHLSPGDQVLLNLWNGYHLMNGVTGRIARIEATDRFTKLGIAFDTPYLNDPDLLALIEN